MPEGQWQRGVIPRLRSGAAAESIRLRWHRNGREERPHVRGQGTRLRGDTQRPRSGAAGGRSFPTPEARGGGGEDQSHAVAARAQEGLEEISHVEGQEGRW